MYNAMIGLYAIKQRMPVTVLYTSLDHLWFVDHFFLWTLTFSVEKNITGDQHLQMSVY